MLLACHYLALAAFVFIAWSSWFLAPNTDDEDSVVNLTTLSVDCVCTGTLVTNGVSWIFRTSKSVTVRMYTLVHQKPDPGGPYNVRFQAGGGPAVLCGLVYV